MIYKITEHEETPRNYIVMEKLDFVGFVSVHKLAVFEDDSMVFTYYNGIQIVQKYEAPKNDN